MTLHEQFCCEPFGGVLWGQVMGLRAGHTWPLGHAPGHAPTWVKKEFASLFENVPCRGHTTMQSRGGGGELHCHVLEVHMTMSCSTQSTASCSGQSCVRIHGACLCFRDESAPNVSSHPTHFAAARPLPSHGLSEGPICSPTSGCAPLSCMARPPACPTHHPLPVDARFACTSPMCIMTTLPCLRLLPLCASVCVFACVSLHLHNN